jgi:hypothetical protein
VAVCVDRPLACCSLTAVVAVPLCFRSTQQEEELRDTILVVFANKQDQPRALRADQVSEGLGLTEIRSRQWSIHETSAVQGKGLFEVRRSSSRLAGDSHRS